jgi:response regulator RpfG family c-di-GMP phosphodiesterase
MSLFLNKFTDFLSIKAIVLIGVAIMALVIIAFASIMIYLSSTIKYDQKTLKKILQIEKRSKDVSDVIRALNYLDLKIILAKNEFQHEILEPLLLEEISAKKLIKLDDNKELENKYNKSILKAVQLANDRIELQHNIYEKVRIILFYKNELSEYILNINKFIDNIINVTNDLSNKMSLINKKLNHEIKNKIVKKENLDKELIDGIKKLFSSNIQDITILTKTIDKSILKLSNTFTRIEFSTNINDLNNLEYKELEKTKSLFENTLASISKYKDINPEKLNTIRMNILKINELRNYILTSKRQMLTIEDELIQSISENTDISRKLFMSLSIINSITNEIKTKVLEHSDNIARSTTIVVIIVGIILFILIVFSAITLISRINIPLEYISKFIKNATSKEKNLLENIKVNVHDEFGELSDSFNNMTTTIYGNIHKIKDLNKEIEDTQKEIIFTMGAIGESKSKETGNHVKRVAKYSELLALLYGMNKDEAELLKLSSPMHDIGKVAIPDSILKKNGKLTDEEFKYMKSHATLGYDMLKHSNRIILKTASIVAFEHHEKWDGSGYPRAIKEEEIHIFGRITAIADVFDALGSDRCYKSAWKDEKIIELFKEEKGKHFDPKLTDLFLNNFKSFVEIRDKYKDAF